MKTILPIIPLLLGACAVAAEEHVWQKPGTFEPISRTAEAITGAITLTDTPSIAFASGAGAGLTSEGIVSAAWGVSGETQTGEVFLLDSDPGALLSGNTLCSEGQGQIYVVFHQSIPFGTEPVLNAAFFRANTAPQNIDSDGLCGTFSYAVP